MTATHEIDRRQYTEDEFNEKIEEGLLPGFRERAPFGKHLFLGKTAIQPVVTGIFLKQIGEKKWGIVGGIRDEEENAHSHPGVWSPPTWRITHNETYDTLSENEARRIPIGDGHMAALDEFHAVEGLGPKNATLVADHIPPVDITIDSSSRLAKVFYERSRDKLLSNPDDKQTSPWHSPSRLWLGPVIEGASGVGDKKLEPVAMLGKVAIVDDFPPARTKHYHHLSVVPVEEFLAGLEAKDVATVDPSVCEDDDYLLRYCIFGLCNEVAKLAVERHMKYIDRIEGGI
jgi:hypothetical protein